MTDQELLDRITAQADVMAGKPVVRRTRLTVPYLLGLLAHGATVQEILDEYPGLTRDDVTACLAFDSRVMARA
jgi:uncharacterized protein (DUF433 family)